MLYQLAMHVQAISFSCPIVDRNVFAISAFTFMANTVLNALETVKETFQ